MRTDRILDEIRAIRDAHAQGFNYDLNAIFADIKRHEKELRKQGWKFARPPRRRSVAKNIAA
jgi:hypothetical protein